MAIDPRISLAVRAPDIGGAINSALVNAQRIQQLGQAREQAPLQNQLLQAQVAGAEATTQSQVQDNELLGLHTFSQGLQGDIQSGNLERLESTFLAKISEGNASPAIFEGLDLVRSGNLQGLQQATSNIANMATQRGLLGRQQLDTASSRDFQQFQALQQQAQASGDPADIEAARQFGIQARFLPEERSRIAIDQARGIAGARADVEAATAPTIAGDVAGAKVEAVAAAEAKTAQTVAKTRSFINRQVKLAEKAAAEEGDVLTDLARMKAALPGLTDVVGKLRELAPIATSTFGGRVFDVAVKELGFGATKGATASAKFGAMVNNQVLPLLKPTFGAAFTLEEGNTLRATMGDVKASVEEKMATLDAFIEQKQRDIETKQRQLDQGSPQELQNLSDEDLFNF